jgi:hypothetical protein|tara:strand:+ start:290 stop:550 length:261 start_codon:yes stop_codon:yes gene_type:complete
MKVGCWIRRGTEWETKEFAEQDVEKLKAEGKKARLNSAVINDKTPFGRFTGKRWFAEEYVPYMVKYRKKGAWRGWAYKIVRGGEEE